MKRLSIVFFLLALLIAGVTLAAVLVRANAIIEAQRSAPAPAMVTSLASLAAQVGQARLLESRPKVRFSENQSQSTALSSA